MGLHRADLPEPVQSAFARGIAIPAHPLALDATRRLDERRQRGLSRYYMDAGSGGLAVGVHTTQFEIRDVGLLEPVLRLAAEEMEASSNRDLIRIAGIVGKTEQAIAEAQLARGLGYHAGLLSLAAWRGSDNDQIIEHAKAIAKEIPIIGFYLQTAVGGMALGPHFWRQFSEIDNVIGIKIAPFNRYKTIDVIRGVIEAGAEDRITLYTGNDDHIVADLLTPFTMMRDGVPVTVRIRGGLLGHWSVWTRTAVTLLERCHAAADGNAIPTDLLALDSQVTDCNAAVFDVRNNFAGCIAGCHEVLRRQGLLEGILCLNPDETLGPGQAAELDRVTAAYPHLQDDEFIAANLDRWLS